MVVSQLAGLFQPAYNLVLLSYKNFSREEIIT